MSPFNMFGFEIGDGWFSIIYEALLAMEALRTKNNEEIRIDQIKEKFGTLRFYVTGPEEAMDIADTAEEKSHGVCEVCGEPGSIVNRSGWYVTRCQRHWKSDENLSNQEIKSLISRISDNL